jgi:serine/threonine-protein kinase
MRRFAFGSSGESQAAARVDDPHLIPIYAAGQADGILFIAMRYVAGGDAQSLLAREGPLPGGRAASIISQVASALDAAHVADLVHRDVKPANILLDVRPDRPDHAYLADFGISRRVQSLARLTGTASSLALCIMLRRSKSGVRR